MTEVGYSLSSEEHKPNELVTHAQLAEQAGFKFVIISDHFHPWTSQQGESSFVWSVLGGIAHATKHITAGTGVTCPILRFHPALTAQAAATMADMMPGRFFLGLGTGEYLNEHIYGHPWPDYMTRREMLIEAVHIIRELWMGEEYSYNGLYYSVKDARLYTLPKQLPPLYIAASGPDSATLAAEIADGLISTTSGDKVTSAFNGSGGSGKPCFGQIKLCWAKTEEEARKVMKKWWPVSALSGRLHVDMPTPKHFEDAVKLMDEPEIPEDSILGPKLDPYMQAIRTMQENGFSHVYLHQVGPDQEGFLDFFKNKLLPALEHEGLVENPVKV